MSAQAKQQAKAQYQKCVGQIQPGDVVEVYTESIGYIGWIPRNDSHSITPYMAGKPTRRFTDGRMIPILVDQTGHQESCWADAPYIRIARIIKVPSP